MTSDLAVDQIPVPVLYMTAGDSIEANTAARELLGIGTKTTLEELAASLYGADADALTAALDGTSEPTSEPVILRWGSTPPVQFLELSTTLLGNDERIIVVTDRTEQYRLDAATTRTTGSALFFTDENGIVEWVSPLSAAVLATAQRHLIGLDLLGIVHPDDRAALRTRLDELVAHPGVELRGAFRFRHPSVENAWWRVVVTASHQPARPAVGGLLVRFELSGDTGVDGDDQAGSGFSSPRLQSLAEIAPVGIISASGGTLMLRNALARNLIGPLLDDMDPYRWVEAVHPEHRVALLGALRDATEIGRTTVTNVAVDAPDGTVKWLRAEAIPTTSDAGRYIGYVATLLDVTKETNQTQELRAAQSQLWELANHDTLTGLPNRLHFCDRLTSTLKQKRRDDREVALLYCDLDRFKPVNDTYGHGVGDRVLAVVAERIRKVTRETDTISRYGGDEFLILCEEYSDIDEVRSIAERVIEAVSAPIFIDGNEISVGVSIGIAVATNDMDTERLVMTADQAMYEAKRTGRGRVVLAHRSQDR